MMKWVAPSTLVTHLITNRAGMPPWNTRIDWVALALDNWDLVCFSLLPLTRAFVRQVYIPGKCWTTINGISPFTDPLFKDANRKLLKDLATKPKSNDPHRRGPLMEASSELCYCRTKRPGHTDHTVFGNAYIQKYIPDMRADEQMLRQLAADHERELAASRLEVAKKVPKTVTKERKGRRAMKKEAMAAAAAAAAEEKKEGQAVASGSQEKKTTSAQVENPPAEEREKPLSERLLDITDAVCDVFEEMQNVVKT